MYMILRWMGKSDDKVRAVCNRDGTIKLFNAVREADSFANLSPYSADMRVISIEEAQDPNV